MRVKTEFGIEHNAYALRAIPNKDSTRLMRNNNHKIKPVTYIGVP